MCSLYGVKEAEENYCTYQSHVSACLPASALGLWIHWWSAWACCSPPSGRLWTGGHQSPGLRSVQTDTNQSAINRLAGSKLVADIIWNEFAVSPSFLSCVFNIGQENAVTVCRILSRNLWLMATKCVQRLQFLVIVHCLFWSDHFNCKPGAKKTSWLFCLWLWAIFKISTVSMQTQCLFVPLILHISF